MKSVAVAGRIRSFLQALHEEYEHSNDSGLAYHKDVVIYLFSTAVLPFFFAGWPVCVV